MLASCPPPPHLTATVAVAWGPDDRQTPHVDGVLTNTGGPASGVQVHLSLVDDTGRVLDTETTYPSLITVPSGATVGWDAKLQRGAALAGHWRVDSVDAVPAPAVISHSFTTTVTSVVHQTALGPGELRGTVRNDSGAPTQWVDVSAVFRGAGGDVTSVAVGHTEVLQGTGVLAPGASAPFVIYLDAHAPAWVSVDLTGEGSDPVEVADCQAPPATSAHGLAHVSTPPHAGVITHAPVLAAPAVVPTSPLPDLRTRVPSAVPAPSPTIVTAAEVRRVPSAWSRHSGLVWIAAGLIVVIGGFGEAIRAGQRLVRREALEAELFTRA